MKLTLKLVTRRTLLKAIMKVSHLKLQKKKDTSKKKSLLNIHMKRTHKCNQVTEDLIGQEISVTGWIHRRRDHGGVIFFDLRDEDGLVQVVYNPESENTFSLAET